VAGIEPA